MKIDQPERQLEMAHVLFMDIISYSLLPMDEQPEAMYELQEECARRPSSSGRHLVTS